MTKISRRKSGMAVCFAEMPCFQVGRPSSVTGTGEIKGTEIKMDGCVKESIEAVRIFVGELTGTPATDEEIAAALRRYFVLNEICDTVKMDRENSEQQESAEKEADVGKD